MSTEPLYTYVKGQGWVINPPREVIDKHDKRYIMEPRRPVNGEYYEWVFKYGNGWVNVDGTPNLDQFAEYARDHGISRVCRDNTDLWNEGVYVTFVPTSG